MRDRHHRIERALGRLDVALPTADHADVAVLVGFKADPATAIGDVVVEHAAGFFPIDRARDREAGAVFDHPVRIARRQRQIGDDCVGGRCGIDLAEDHPVDPFISRAAGDGYHRHGRPGFDPHDLGGERRGEQRQRCQQQRDLSGGHSAGIHFEVVARGLRYLVRVQPPSTTIDWPLIISPPGEHRNAMVAATSAGSASRG